MEHTLPLPFLEELLLFLVVAGLLIPVLERLRVNQVLGFLAAGTLLGPGGLGQFASQWPWLHWVSFPDTRPVQTLAEAGVLFLLFMIGLELSADRLWTLRRWVFGAGGAQVLGCSLVIGGIAAAFGNGQSSSLVLGLVLALSSTAVVMQLLSERRALGTPMGQAVFAVLLFQDLAVVPLLVLVDALGTGSTGGQLWLALAIALLKAVAAIVAIYFLGTRLLRPLFRWLLRRHQPDVFVALILLSTLGISALTWLAGLSMALGAFLAGLLLAETEYRHEVEVTIEPFKGLLMSLFFMSIGMSLRPEALLEEPVLLPVAVIGLIVVKAVTTTAVLAVSGLRPGRALEAGLLLGQGGEFAFIVVVAAAAKGLVEPPVASFMMLVVTLSMFATPAAARLGRLAGDALERRRQPAGETGDDAALDALDRHVIIAGYGRIGRMLAGLLDAHGIRYVAIETDGATAGREHRAGRPVYYGNIARPDLLKRLHLERAAAVVLTMDHPGSALHALQAVRRCDAHVPVIARARDEANAAALMQAGATSAVPEALEAALQLSAVTLESLGVPTADALRSVEGERARRSGAPGLTASR